MPYPQHVDEYHVLVNGMIMRNNENLFPGILCYPSFPIYFCAIISEITHSFEHHFLTHKKKDNFSVENYPYYKENLSITTNKIIVACLSLLIPLLLSLVILHLTESKVFSLLCFVIICLSELYTYHSRAYINIDIFASMFVSINIFYFVFLFNRKNILRHIILPGVLTGLTISSKYPHGLILLIYLYSYFACKDYTFIKKFVLSLSTFTIALFTTLICCPYIFIFPDQWFAEIIIQRNVYRNGWPGYTIEPGLPNLAVQIKQLFQEFGTINSLLSFFGILFLILKRHKLSIPILLYFIVFLIYFSSHSVNLVRNLLPLYALWGVFISLGGYYLFIYLKPKIGVKPSFLILLFLVLFSLPSSKISKIFKNIPETRNAVSDFVITNLDIGNKLIVAKELGLYLKPLQGFQIQEVNFLDKDRKSLNPQLHDLVNENDIFIYPEFCADLRWPKDDRYALKLNQSLNDINPLFFAAGNVGGSDGYMNLSRAGIQVKSNPPSPWGNPTIKLTRGLSIKSTP